MKTKSDDRPHEKRRGELRNGNPPGDFSKAPRCGAKNRRGSPCRCPAMRNGRCRLHGGLSTGPTTAEGVHVSIPGGCSEGTVALQAPPASSCCRLIVLPDERKHLRFDRGYCVDTAHRALTALASDPRIAFPQWADYVPRSAPSRLIVEGTSSFPNTLRLGVGTPVTGRMALGECALSPIRHSQDAHICRHQTNVGHGP